MNKEDKKWILSVLSTDTPMTLEEIAEAAKIDRESVTPIVCELVKQGVVASFLYFGAGAFDSDPIFGYCLAGSLGGHATPPQGEEA